MKLLTVDPRKIFLLDAIGALLTASLLFLVVRKYALLFGVPPTWSKMLAGIALALSVYSFCCYFLAGDKWKLLMKIIAVCNMLYCCITLAIILMLTETITTLGIAYFLIEIAVILALVIFELRIVRR